MKYILTVVYLAFSTSGLLLFKLGGDTLRISFMKGIEFKIGYTTFAGLCCYLISFLLWQKLLATYDLSYIVPLTTGISQIIILCFGILIFNEKINWIGLVGVLMVIGGVVLLTVGKTN